VKRSEEEPGSLSALLLGVTVCARSAIFCGSCTGERQEAKNEGKRVYGWAWGFVLAVFAASRLFYLLGATLLAPIVPISPLQRQTSIFPFDTLSIWATFDGEHYVSVAESGYAQDSPAFFPLYPLLVRLSTALFGGSSREALSLLTGSSSPW
jgi:hypothetical protein